VIQPLDDAFAEILKEPRAGFVTSTQVGLAIRQAGAAYVGGPFEVPVTPFELTNGEPAIETFVVSAAGPIVPTGENQDLIDLWQPSAQLMANEVMTACTSFEIELVEPGYLTASALPLDRVSHEPHFDDDQYTPTDGVSVVAIAANHAGTRCTTLPIDVAAVPAGAPISLPGETQDRFDEGHHPSEESEPGRIVIFPQFGQLHSGPVLTTVDPTVLRTLYVLRFKTAGESTPTSRRSRRARSSPRA
jgi:hypothetical protein